MRINLLGLLIITWLTTPILAQPIHPPLYRYPLHNTQNHTQLEPIIIRLPTPIDQPTLQQLTQTQIVGSQSGKHTHHTALSTDKKTVTLSVNQPFHTSEWVTVQLPNNPIIWKFRISTLPDEEQKQKWQAYKQTQLPTTIPSTIGSIVYDSIAPTAKGYLVAPSLQPGINLLYNNGNIFRHADLDPSPVFLKPLRDSLLAVYNQNGFILFNQHLQQLYFASPSDALTTIDFHDFELSPASNPVFITSSFNPMDISPWFPGVGEKDVLDYIITELDIQTGVPVWRWRCLDHLTVAEGINNSSGAISTNGNPLDFFHWNSISLTPDSQYVISMRNCNAAYKINSTNGNIQWKLGGNNSTFQFQNDPENGFTLQHHVVLTDSNKITVFDNGIFHLPPRSRAVEYQLNETDSTATLLQDIPSPNNGLSQIMGSVQALPNGNKLVCWGRVINTGNTHYITEYDSYGNLVYDIHGSTSKTVYRAYRMNLPPEIVSSLSQLQLTPRLAVLAYPNPTSQQLHLNIYTPTPPHHLQLTISNAAGKCIVQQSETPTTTTTHLVLDTHLWAAGTYYYTLVTDNHTAQSGSLHIVH